MDPTGNGADVEAPKDPGALKSHPSLSDNEILGEKRPKKVTIVFDPFCALQATAMCTSASTCRARAVAPGTGTTTAAATGAGRGTGTTAADTSRGERQGRTTGQVSKKLSHYWRRLFTLQMCSLIVQKILIYER